MLSNGNQKSVKATQQQTGLYSPVVLKEALLNMHLFLYLCVTGGESFLVATESPYVEKYTVSVSVRS